MAERDGHDPDGERPWERNPLGHNPLLDDEAVLAELFGARPGAGIPAAGALPPGPALPIGGDGAGPPPRRSPPSFPGEIPFPEGSEGEQAPRSPRRRRARRRRAADRPTHYKVVSFSLYKEDIDRLEELVRKLKERGHSKANKSQVVRFALATVDIDAMPKPV